MPLKADGDIDLAALGMTTEELAAKALADDPITTPDALLEAFLASRGA